ncbi:MAG TPA: glycosyltransferase family 4 protein [Acidimicrobiales bacterium]
MTAPLRVVQVVCSDAFAGVERYVANVSNSLAEVGCEVSVLGGDRQRMTKELSGDQKGWWPAATVPEAIRGLIRVGHVDIVHTHMTAAEMAAATVRIASSGRFVTTRHFAARRGSGLPGRLASVAIRRLVHSQLAVSDYVAARVDGPSVVLPSGVPNQASVPPEKRTPVVLVAQRLEAEKQTDLALRAWQRSELALSGWELHLAGDGAQVGHLRRLAEELGVTDSCRFLGRRDDMAERYQTASLFLALQPDEALGLSVLEAMAAGLPVVAAAGGGHLETVGAAPDAALFAPGDVEEAAQLLRSLGADQERRQAYGQQLQALQRQRFDSSVQAKKMVVLYERLINGDR